MAIKSLIEAVALDETVFRANMEPSDVQRLGGGLPSGDVSIVVIDPPVKALDGRLEFDLAAARVLAVGTSNRAVIILSETTDSGAHMNGDLSVNRAPLEEERETADTIDGDEQYIAALHIADLPAELRETGENLIRGIRRSYPGRLIRADSGKFVNEPDPFFAIKIQPRARDLAINVRGYPWEFDAPLHFGLKIDRGSHSKFKISRLEDVHDAVAVVGQARKK